MNRLLNGVVVTESLPLGVDRVYTSPRKKPFPDESLPVDLVFVFLTRIIVGNLEYFHQLPDRKPRPLPKIPPGVFFFDLRA